MLMNLRTDKLIEENFLLTQLEKMEKLTKDKSEPPHPPLLAILQTVDQNYLVTELNLKLDAIENKIEIIITDWEKKTLTDDEARGRISELVESKQSFVLQRKSLNSFITERLNYLTSIIKESGLNSKDFFMSEYSGSQFQLEKGIQNAFLEIWINYQSQDPDHEKQADNLKVSEIIESDILKAFISPATDEQDQVKFHLEDIIKPLPDIISQKPLFQGSKEQQEEPTSSRDQQEDKSSPQIGTLDQNYWKYVGLVAYNRKEKPIGLIRAPIQVNEVYYLPIVLEERLSFALIKSKYFSPLHDMGIDLSTVSTEEIQLKISDTLNIPPQLSFQPSFFNEWLSLLSADFTPIKPKIANVWFLKTDSVKFSSNDSLILDESELEKLSLPAWIPVPSPSPPFSPTIGAMIKGIAGSHFGKITGVMNQTPFGHSMIIERPIPPSTLLDIFLQGLGKQNLAELRFYLAKTLKVGEGEVFSPNNMWKINFQERLLRSPHEIAIAYYSIFPSCAFHITTELKAKIGIYFHSISESLRFLTGKSLYKNNSHFGTIYGFKIENQELFVLYSPLSADQLVQQVGRKHSHQHVDRFRKRISLALAVPENESLWPNNLAVYYLNFIFPMREEFNLLPNTMAEIEAKFALKLISFSEFDSITKEGLHCG
ncbi:MAG: hypothetical protein ACW98F_10195 [Candidatus Hodarchaeales archaeon]|jgi:hypothetical protein